MKIPEVLIVRSKHQAGSLARILTVIGDAGVVVEGLKTVGRDHRGSLWEITVEPEQDFPVRDVIDALNALPNAEVIGRSDRVFERHRGGKLRTVSSHPINSDEVLRDVYTPGVARVCLAIRDDPEQANELTSIGRTVAIVTDGTAVLGLGDVGSVAGMPVMEGKAALLADLVGLNAVPILLDADTVDKKIEAIAAISPSFGAIQLEDIKAPECFVIEEALKAALPVPVMHDDQHGTAVVTLAALLSAAEETKRHLQDCVVGQIGLGAAGIGISRLLMRYGVKKVLGADLNQAAIDRLESMGGKGADLETLMREADVVVSTTGVPGLIKPEWVQQGQIILALSNPVPEILPEIALEQGAAYATDGKVVNNLLGFPGIFKGALDAGADRITDRMLIAAAECISRLRTGGLVPRALDKSVHEKVALAVTTAVG